MLDSSLKKQRDSNTDIFLPVAFAKLLRTQNTVEFVKSYIEGVHKRFFNGKLQRDSHLISKTNSTHLVSPFPFSAFLYNLFFY